MGNYISKIIKDHFFAFEEFLKENIQMFERNARIFLEMYAGKTYSGLHSIKKYYNIKVLAPLHTRGWWKDF